MITVLLFRNSTEKVPELRLGQGGSTSQHTKSETSTQSSFAKVSANLGHEGLALHTV